MDPRVIRKNEWGVVLRQSACGTLSHTSSESKKEGGGGGGGVGGGWKEVELRNLNPVWRGRESVEKRAGG